MTADTVLHSKDLGGAADGLEYVHFLSRKPYSVHTFDGVQIQSQDAA